MTRQKWCIVQLEYKYLLEPLYNYSGFSSVKTTIDNLVVLAAVLGVKIDDILVTTDMRDSVSA